MNLRQGVNEIIGAGGEYCLFPINFNFVVSHSGRALKDHAVDIANESSKLWRTVDVHC